MITLFFSHLCQLYLVTYILKSKHMRIIDQQKKQCTKNASNLIYDGPPKTMCGPLGESRKHAHVSIRYKIKNQFTSKQSNHTIGDGPWAMERSGSSDDMTRTKPPEWTPTEGFSGLCLLRQLERGTTLTIRKRALIIGRGEGAKGIKQGEGAGGLLGEGAGACQLGSRQSL